MTTNTENTKKRSRRLLILLALLTAAGLTIAALFRPPAPAPAADAPAAEEASPAPTATPEPAGSFRRGYFPADGPLFRPEDPLTQAEAEALVSSITGKTHSADASGDQAVTEQTLPAYLERCFSPEAVAEVMTTVRGRGDETVTRAEAAVCINRLWGFSPEDAPEGYFPDVAPDHWAYAHILAAAEETDTPALPQGFVNLNGWLYWVDADGYFQKDVYLDSLYFDKTGRYTSGSPELDAHVARAIAENTTEDMTREEMLRSMYLYVRSSFEYLRRNYYKTGELNWQLQEALTMYDTGKGNCYCYAAAFWAAARGLGYNARAVCGTVGEQNSPHGWVEIVLAGERHTYDVELEMAMHRDGHTRTDLYQMTDRQRRHWNYVEADYSDDMAHREMAPALLPY